MCFNFPYGLKKGKFVIIRKWCGDDEDKEEIGLLAKEFEKWNKKSAELKISPGDNLEKNKIN